MPTRATEPVEHWLPQPDLDAIDVDTVLRALADPVRLEIVRALHAVGEATCSSLDVPVKPSTVSHHLRALREAGVVATRLDGNARPSRLRYDDLERRFPGLLGAILRAVPATGDAVGSAEPRAERGRLLTSSPDTDR